MRKMFFGLFVVSLFGTCALAALDDTSAGGSNVVRCEFSLGGTIEINIGEATGNEIELDESLTVTFYSGPEDPINDRNFSIRVMDRGAEVFRGTWQRVPQSNVFLGHGFTGLLHVSDLSLNREIQFFCYAYPEVNPSRR